MYARINLTRRVLISPQEVINNIASDDNLPHEKVVHSIVIAEERFVRPFLGWDQYEALLASKNVYVADANIVALQAKFNALYAGSNIPALKVGDIVNASELLDADQLKLWNEYLCKYIAECVKFIAMPESFANFTNQGIMKNNPAVPIVSDDSAKSASVALKEVQWLMDKWINDRLEPLKMAIHTFICRYRDKYPLYTQPCICETIEKPVMPKTSWVMIDLYNDDDDNYKMPAAQPAQPVAAVPAVFTEPFVTIPGQTQYPYPGQFNEDTILQKLKGATLISLVQEGATMFFGNGPGEVIGIDPGTGRITWVTPAPDQEVGLRMIATITR